MALTEKQIGNLTVRDIERIAQRFGSALETIREGQSLLGGSQWGAGPVAQTLPVVNALAKRRRANTSLPEPEPPPLADPHRGVRPASSVNWSAEERAQREAMRRKREEEAAKAVEEADA